MPIESPGLGFTHTCYWRPVRGKTGHLAALRSALQLEARNELLELLRAIPAFALIEPRESREK